jgi:hypothetical protein
MPPDMNSVFWGRNKMAGQNYELLKKIEEMERILEEKHGKIEWLKKRLSERNP